MARGTDCVCSQSQEGRSLTDAEAQDRLRSISRPGRQPHGNQRLGGQGGPMPAFVDKSGIRVDMVVVLRRAGSDEHGATWVGRCDCGTEREFRSGVLKQGRKLSCGCVSVKIIGHRQSRHGLSNSPEFVTHRNMIRRCIDSRNKDYVNYGFLGIRVCERWASEGGLKRFVEDMGPRPSPKHSIDRIDVRGPYSPENCRWATSKEQNNNKRSNSFLGLKDQVLTISQWSDVTGIAPGTIWRRINGLGWTAEQALTSPVSQAKRRFERAKV